jgi:hypothetical protein
MQPLRLCLAVAWLLVWDWPAIAASPPPAGQVEHVPTDEAVAILGGPVTAPDGKMIGRLVDVLVDAAGVPEAAVIDVGGFMGVGARKIAVHWSVLHFAPANQKQPITLDLTLDQLKAAPEYGNPAKPAPVVLPAKTETAPNNGAASSGVPSNAVTPKGGEATGSTPTDHTPADRTPTAGAPANGTEGGTPTSTTSSAPPNGSASAKPGSGAPASSTTGSGSTSSPPAGPTAPPKPQ